MLRKHSGGSSFFSTKMSQSPPKLHMLHIRPLTCHTSPAKISSLDETLNTMCYYYCLSFILDHTGLLDDSSQIIEFLTPARAQCKALAQQFDLDPNALSNASTDPFDIMLDKLLNTKKVTPKQLADALGSRQVGHGQLAEKIILYQFSE